MSLTINFPALSTTPNLPTGFGLFRVRGYPIKGYGVNLDAVQRGVQMWAIVPVWVIETQSFSAVKGNVSMIGPTDIRNLKDLQPNDGYTLSEKMGWLVHGVTDNDPNGWGVAPMWTGKGNGDWNTANAYYVGSQLWAGQVCAASLETYRVQINGEFVPCRKLYSFKPSDWKVMDAPWLFPTCCIARKTDNSLSFDFGRGTVRSMLQVLSYPEYEFVGNAKPSAYYVPADWLTAY